jgi:hypothetical protein
MHESRVIYMHRNSAKKFVDTLIIMHYHNFAAVKREANIITDITHLPYSLTYTNNPSFITVIVIGS